MNGFPIIVTGVVVLILLGFVFARRKQTWAVVYEGAELTERASNQLALLQDNGIRCRIRNKELRPNPNAGIVNQDSTVSSDFKTIIEIHQGDIDKARQLLEQQISGQYELNL